LNGGRGKTVSRRRVAGCLSFSRCTLVTVVWAAARRPYAPICQGAPPIPRGCRSAGDGCPTGALKGRWPRTSPGCQLCIIFRMACRLAIIAVASCFCCSTSWL
jgi:hypothetical protein